MTSIVLTNNQSVSDFQLIQSIFNLHIKGNVDFKERLITRKFLHYLRFVLLAKEP
jgi:hypothetical protein